MIAFIFGGKYFLVPYILCSIYCSLKDELIVLSSCHNRQAQSCCSQALHVAGRSNIARISIFSKSCQYLLAIYVALCRFSGFLNFLIRVLTKFQLALRMTDHFISGLRLTFDIGHVIGLYSFLVDFINEWCD